MPEYLWSSIWWVNPKLNVSNSKIKKRIQSPPLEDLGGRKPKTQNCKFQNQRRIPTSKIKNRWSLFLNRLKGFTEMKRGFTEIHRGKKNRKFQFRVRQGGMPPCLLAMPFRGIDNIFSESKIWAFLEGCYDPQFFVLPQYTKPRMGEMIIASY